MLFKWFSTLYMKALGIPKWWKPNKVPDRIDAVRVRPIFLAKYSIPSVEGSSISCSFALSRRGGVRSPSGWGGGMGWRVRRKDAKSVSSGHSERIERLSHFGIACIWCNYAALAILAVRYGVSSFVFASETYYT